MSTWERWDEDRWRRLGQDNTPRGYGVIRQKFPAAAIKNARDYGYAKRDEAQGDAPTTEEFITFAEAAGLDRVTFETYVVSPHREDRRITVEGILIKDATPAERNWLYRNSPDELDEFGGLIRAWWD